MKQKSLLDSREAKALREQAELLHELDSLVARNETFCREKIWGMRVKIFAALGIENNPNTSDQKLFSLYNAERAVRGNSEVNVELVAYQKAAADCTAAAEKAAKLRPGLRKTLEALFEKQREGLLDLYRERMTEIIKALQPFCDDADQAESLAQQTSAATTLYSSAVSWDFPAHSPDLPKLCNRMLKSLNA